MRTCEFEAQNMDWVIDQHSRPWKILRDRFFLSSVTAISAIQIMLLSFFQWGNRTASNSTDNDTDRALGSLTV